MKTIIRLTLILIVLLGSYDATYSQLKVFDNGSVEINSYVGNYGRAIYTKVYYPDACAYHLQYNGEDKFFVSARGFLWCKEGGYFGSDKKLKKDIKPINSAISTIKELNGISFNYIEEEDNNVDSKSNINPKNSFRLGLIANEVEKVLPGIVKTMPDDSKAIAYYDLTALLIEAIKEQQLQVEALQKIIISHEEELIELRKVNQKNVDIIDDFDKFEDAKLYQNMPNPFSFATKISFYIPIGFENALLHIYDLQGNEIKSFNINKSGNGMVEIAGSELKAGMYMYSLLIDNRIVDSKRMILTSN